MATITKREDATPSRRWQAKIRRKGFPEQSQAFATRAKAEEWARAAEVEMDQGTFVDRTTAKNTTLAYLLERYRDEVSILKKGHVDEAARIAALLRQDISKYSAATLTGVVLAKWRDTRLTAVSGSTVNRDLNLLSHVLNTARKEWAISIPVNPVSQITRPKHNPGRERRAEGDEASILLTACADARNPFLYPLVLLALETGMRRGELIYLEWPNIHLVKRTAYLPSSGTKTGKARHVPLSSLAVSTLSALTTDRAGRVFPGLTPNAVKLAYARALKRGKLQGLRLHDLRHEATSRFFEKGLNPMEVASITGHSLSMLKRYTHLKAEELAKKLG